MTEDVERFLSDLASGILLGNASLGEEHARAMAEKVLQRLYDIGPFAYPSLLDEAGLRFVYQWDENPPLMTVMLWDDVMWRDMARVPVPDAINRDINQ